MEYSADNVKSWLPVLNQSGEQIPPFGVIKITGIEQEAQDDSYVLTGEKPDTYGSQYSHFVNGQTAIEADDRGVCTNSFPAIAAYDTADGTPEAGERWGPREDSWLLKKDTGGFRVLGVVNKEKGWVLVSQQPMLHFWGKTTEDIDQDDSGEVEIYAGTEDEKTTTDVMIEAWNTLGDVAEDVWVRCFWNEVDEKWEIVNAECA